MICAHIIGFGLTVRGSGEANSYAVTVRAAEAARSRRAAGPAGSPDGHVIVRSATRFSVIESVGVLAEVD